MYGSGIRCQVRSKHHFFAVGVGGEIGEEEFLLPEFLGGAGMPGSGRSGSFPEAMIERYILMIKLEKNWRCKAEKNIRLQPEEWIAMSKINYKNLLSFGIWIFFAFFLFIFFANIYPLVIFDSDDWGNAGFMRTALPSLIFYNPAKILPETVAPLSSKIGQYFFLPLTGDYIRSMTLAYSLVLTFFIMFYSLMLDKTLKSLFKLKTSGSLVLTAFFVLFHFSIFRINPDNNQFLFGSTNLTCIWHYVIPNLFASAMVLWHITRKKKDMISSPVLQGLVFFACYMAIFSNLYSSIILASYAGVSLLFNIVKSFRSQLEKTERYRSINYFVILCFWAVSLFFEYNGERAKIFSDFRLNTSIANFVDWIYQINKLTLLVLLLFVFLGIFTIIKIRDGRWFLLETLAELILCAVIEVIFLVLLSAKTGGRYIARIDVIFGVFFYLLLIVIILAAFSINHFPRFLIFLPLIFFIVLSNTCVGNRIYREINLLNLDPRSAIAVSNDLIAQVVAADKANMNEVTVYVPKYNSADNWPHALYMGPNFGATLYRHGVTSKRMNVTVIPSEEKNIEFNISR